MINFSQFALFGNDVIILFCALAALTGILVKSVDQLEDVFKKENKAKFILAILYGILIGFSISFSSFSSLWIAVLLAQLIAGKVDRKSHMLGVGVAIVFIAIFGINEINLTNFLILLIFASIDEFNPFKWQQNLRPALKFATLGFVILGRWDYFFAIISFDLAYLFAEYLLGSTKQVKTSVKKRKRA